MLINDVKTALRISHNRLDTEIDQHISACCADMTRVGIAVPDDIEDITDTSLLYIAVILWCKAQYDYLGKGEEYRKGYESLRNTLSLSKDYRRSDDA